MTAPRDAAVRWRVERFDSLERAVHWLTAVLGLVVLATAAVLYVPDLSSAVGRRYQVRALHAGFAAMLPLPLLAGLAARRGTKLRVDIARLASLGPGESALRPRHGADKFVVGQKLVAGAFLGAFVALAVSGLVLLVPEPFPIEVREGATFVHDVAAVATGALLAGHVAAALLHPQLLRAMVTGWVDLAWVRRRRPGWSRELEPLAPGQLVSEPSGSSSPR